MEKKKIEVERDRSKRLSLAERICAVMADLERVPKRGRNQFHGYDYATESDVADALRPLLAKHGLAVIPSVESVERRGVETRSGHATYVTVTLRVVLLGGGEQYVTYWQGDAVDGGDKAVYKAYTGAYKYALLRTFCASSGDTDAEQVGPGDAGYVVTQAGDAGRDEAPTVTRGEHAGQEDGSLGESDGDGGRPGRITRRQLRLLQARCAEAGVDISAAKRYIRETYGVKSALELSHQQLDEVLRWVASEGAAGRDDDPDDNPFSDVVIGGDE